MNKANRKTNLELFRIIMMLAIIAHHLVVNSGVMELFNYDNITGNMIFLQFFGFAGKAMINGFILITGYFMIKQNFSLNKIIKLYLEIKFYKFLVYIFLSLLGFQDMGIKALLKSVFNIIYGFNVGFTGTFFVLYLIIPFANKFIMCLNQKLYLYLMCIFLFFFTIVPTFMFSETFCEIGWYIIMYMIGAYIRLFPNKLFESKKYSGISSIIFLVTSYLSILAIDIFNNYFNKSISPYHFVINANKILALVLAVSVFCYFKNINIKYSKFLNTIATTTFGVLLIHANSYSMRNFLWYKLFNISGLYGKALLPIYAIMDVLLIYIVCVLIDLLRIYILEKPLFNALMSLKSYKKLCKIADDFLN